MSVLCLVFSPALGKNIWLWLEAMEGRDGGGGGGVGGERGGELGN